MIKVFADVKVEIGLNRHENGKSGRGVRNVIKIFAIVKVEVRIDEDIRQIGCEVICATRSRTDAIAMLGELQARDGEAGVNFYLYETDYDESSRPDAKP